jgi:hypothetical protein
MMESLSKDLKSCKTNEEKGRAAILAKKQLMQLLVDRSRGYLAHSFKSIETVFGDIISQFDNMVD